MAGPIQGSLGETAGEMRFDLRNIKAIIFIILMKSSWNLDVARRSRVIRKRDLRLL
jgi:hypothetical protein